jgi:hypothetical protein
MKSALIPLMSTALAISALCAAPAHASDVSNAVDVCQGSLPSFEGALRKRPLAIANEGSSSSFVSCSLRAPLASEQITGLFVLFTNRSAATRTVSCTLVDGIAEPFPNLPPVFQPKPIALATGAFGVLSWDQDADNGGDPYNIPNLNCSLPPGVEINTVEMHTETPV